MKLSIWSIGKPHEQYVKVGIEEFTKRISRYFPVEWLIISPPKEMQTLTEASQKKKEAERILELIKPDTYLVVLDEKGKQLSSDSLSSFLEARAGESLKRMVFVIGGVFGVDESVRQKAHFILSLSQLTFPQQLVRLILAEQLYRACTILRNEKYHHK